MNLLSQFVSDPPTRKRLLLFGLSGALALLIGFVVVTPHAAEVLIAHAGYYYMLGLFGLFGFYAIRVARPRQAVWSDWLRRPGWPALAIAGATAFALWSDPFQHKVLFDEYVLQATAFHMHVTKEIGTVIRAYDFNGTWLPIDTFLDKRPYFFTFVLSLVHDLAGYRIANVFFLNAALTAAFLSLAYWFGRELTDRAGGLLVVVLLVTMPLFGQNATGAGMDMHNLTMLILVMCLALLYLRAPDGDRLALLCLATVLLAQSRYESVIFVVPVAVVVLAGWGRARRVLLPWAAVATPLLLIPYAWHQRYVSAAPLLWQLGEGQKTRFGSGYLAENLRNAVEFLFSFRNVYANSWYLSVLGCAGLVYFLVGATRWVRRRPALPPEQVVAVLFGTAIAGNFVMLMFYYWSRLTDSIAARFALPACLLFALAAAVLARRLDGRWPATRVAFWGAGAFLLVSALPAMAHRLYTSQNLVMQEVDWEHDFVMPRGPGTRLFISNKSSIPWMLWQIPSLVIGVARQRGDQLRYHMAQGTFREILVAQALRPTTPDGRFGVDPDDLLPENFQLETLAEKRFGGRMARLSRLVAVAPEPVAPAKAGEKSPAPPGAVKPAS
jgi:hypothetical protein